MCVIAVKEKGQDFPTDSTVRDMWDRNPDGAGFMYTLNKRVYIEKGFMELKEFMNAYAGLEKRLRKQNMTLKDVPMVLHFRITTHGGTNPENTHPYPVSDDSKMLKSLDNYSDLAMAHNGVITSVRSSTGMSDTATYIRDVLFPLFLHSNRFLESKAIRTLIENTISGSRLAFLDKFGKITTIGTFEKGEGGLMYSNLNHEYSYEALYGYGNYYPRGGTYKGYVSKYAKTTKSPSVVSTYEKSDHKSSIEDVKKVVDGLIAYPKNVVPSGISEKVLVPVEEGQLIANSWAMSYDYDYLEFPNLAKVMGTYGAKHFAYDERGDIYVKVPDGLVSAMAKSDLIDVPEWVLSLKYDFAIDRSYETDALGNKTENLEILAALGGEERAFTAKVYGKYSLPTHKEDDHVNKIA